jgi:hypothetical protein
MRRIDRATTQTISGTVVNVTGSITGWVLRLYELKAGGEVLMKTSEDSAQIAILDVNTRTFEIYLGLADTSVARNITVLLRGQNGPKHHVLARDVLEISA